MFMRNNKGFTMVELLGTIVILGLLSTIGVASLSKYLTQSKDKAYRIMSQSIYEAYVNCSIEGKCNLPPVGGSITYNNFKQLVDLGYLDSLKNPNKNQADCYGVMTITGDNMNNKAIEYIKYTYRVELNCSPKNGIIYTWPEDKTK